MFILVEGIDKSGKSTLIRDIQKALPASLYFKNQVKPEKHTSLLSIGRTGGIYLGLYQLDLKDMIVISDRSHLTEIVYSPRRGYNSTNFFDWNGHEKQFLKKKAVVIYMTAPKAKIRERFDSEKEEYISHKEIDGILERYETAMNTTTLPVLTLNSTNPRDFNLARVVEFLAKHK